MLKTSERLAELEREVERLAKAAEAREIVGVVIDCNRYEQLRRIEAIYPELAAEYERTAKSLQEAMAVIAAMNQAVAL